MSVPGESDPRRRSWHENLERAGDPNQSTLSTTGGETQTCSTELYTGPAAGRPGDVGLDYIRLDPPQSPGSLGRLAHYEVFNILGRGAMGIVLRAYDTVLGRTVAIKVMSLALMSNPQARTRFFREARAAAGINHPNVVTIHAVAEHSGVPFLVMEYVNGRPLIDRIRSGAPLGTAAILRIGAQVASGLAAAHEQGVIHRDIKPANIMLEDGVERVKITDFGLARVVMEQSDLTSQGGVVGTPSYMSPEQVNGRPLDPRSDLFSLGCVLYAMVSGHSPFRCENALGTARRVAEQPHVSLAEISRDVPPYLVVLVDRLLEKDPERRFQTAGEVAAELTLHLARLNAGARPAEGLAAPSADARPRGRVARRAAAGVVSLAAAAGILWAAAQYRPRPAIAPTPPVSTPAAAATPTPAAIAQARILRVDKGGHADYASVAEAVRAATPGCTVRVEDGGVYDGSLLLDDPAKHAGMRLEAPAGATLQAGDPRPVLTISGVPGVVVSGFELRSAAGQHALELRGACPGTVVEGCRITSPADSGVAAVYVHAGAAGAPDAPIVLRRLSVRCGGVGVVFGGHSEPAPVRHVTLADCRIRAAGSEYGIPIVLQAGAEHVAIRGNLLYSGQTGFSFAFDGPDRASDVAVVENTLGDFRHAFHFNDSPSEQDVHVDRNLLIGSEAVYAGSRDVEPFSPWFHANWWERGPGLDEALASRFAEPKDPLNLVSRDPDSDDYLKPTAGQPLPFDTGDTPPERRKEPTR